MTIKKVFLVEMDIEHDRVRTVSRLIDECLKKLSQKKYGLGKVNSWTRELEGSERLAIELVRQIRTEAGYEADDKIDGHVDRFDHDRDDPAYS